MSDLRKAIESGRDAYREARFPGDLGDLALAQPKRRSWRAAVVGGLAVAASLAAIVVMQPEEPPTKPQQVVAKTEPAAAKPRPTAQPPSLLAQMRRVSLPTARKRPLRPRLSDFDPLAFKPPKSFKVAAPASTETGVPATASATPERTSKPRRRDLSTPSLALRSMNDAISFGT